MPPFTHDTSRCAPGRSPTAESVRPITHAARNQGAVFSFSVQDRRCDFASAYPELDHACAALGIATAESIADGSADARQTLLMLARAAQPLLDYANGSATAPIPELVAVLRDRQHQAIRWELIRLGHLISWLSEQHHTEESIALHRGWLSFCARLMEHMQEEETTCFPFCVHVALSPDAQFPSMHECMHRIHQMNETHDETQAEIRSLLVLVNRAQCALPDDDLRIVGFGLDALQVTLGMHAELEGEYLLPRCIELVFRARASM